MAVILLARSTRAAAVSGKMSNFAMAGSTFTSIFTSVFTSMGHGIAVASLIRGTSLLALQPVYMYAVYRDTGWMLEHL